MRCIVVRYSAAAATVLFIAFSLLIYYVVVTGSLVTRFQCFASTTTHPVLFCILAFKFFVIVVFLKQRSVAFEEK